MGLAPPAESSSHSACPIYDVYKIGDGTDGCCKENVGSVDLDVDDASLAITEPSVYMEHGPLVCTARS